MEAITKDMFKMFEHKAKSDDDVDGEINALIGLLKNMKTFPPSGAEDQVNIIKMSDNEIEIFKRHGLKAKTGKMGVNLLIERLEKIKTIPASWDADGGNLTLILNNIYEVYKRHGKAK
jgi:hypothetical protein